MNPQNPPDLFRSPRDCFFMSPHYNYVLLYRTLQCKKEHVHQGA